MSQVEPNVRDITLATLVKLIIGSGKRAQYVYELERRLGEEPGLHEYLEAYRPADQRVVGEKQLALTLNDWLAERDAEPPDPHPAGPLVDRILASGWDFSGFHDPPDRVRGFLDSVRKLSELEMTIGQRRYWRTVKRRFRGRLQGDQP